MKKEIKENLFMEKVSDNLYKLTTIYGYKIANRVLHFTCDSQIVSEKEVKYYMAVKWNY